MHDFVVVPDPAELVDVPAVEGAAGEGTGIRQEGSNLLYFIVDVIVSFTSVGEYLVIEVPSQNVDVPVVEADSVGGSPVLEFISQCEGVLVEVVLVYVGGLAFGGAVRPPDEEELPIGDRDGLVEVGYLEVDVDADGFELVALVEVEVVEDVLVVLEEVQVSSTAGVAEGVDPDDLLLVGPEAFLAGLSGDGGALFLLSSGGDGVAHLYEPRGLLGEVGVLAGAGVAAGDVVHGSFVFDLVDDFGHGLEVVLVAVVEGVAEEGVVLLLIVPLDEEVVLVVLLELEDAAEPFPDLLLHLVPVELDDGLGGVQEALAVVELVEEELELGDDAVDAVHLQDEVGLL